MVLAKPGDTVTVSYIGTLDNGRIFDSTDADGPLTFTIGNKQIFPALERAVIGMRAGEARNIVLAAEEAYGPRLKDNIIRIDRKCFPADKCITLGQKLSITFKNGTSKLMLVTEAGEDEITLDANHPLAGCELTFALRLDRID